MIPPEEKEELYDAMVECYASSTSAKEVTYLDGTKRSTWAASASGSLKTCDELSRVADPIRSRFGEVLNHLALKIEESLNSLGHSVAFPKTSAGGEGYYKLHELVSEGEQLDHFHVYFRKGSSSGDDNQLPKTIDWHTDYGFALAFLPGRVIAEDDSSAKYAPSRGFFIRLPDGSAREVTFKEEDDLVILLGDGVNHINNALADDADITFRAVPHSFVMPDENDDALRIWYGRMMLFPERMLHSHLNQSFGDVNKAMNADPTYHLSNEQSGYALGCSSSEVLSSRLLADETMTCDDDQFMCWHACFNHTDDISPTACESRNLELACVSNSDGSIWDGQVHSKEFEPACILLDDEANSPTSTPNVDESPSSTTTTESPTSGSAILVSMCPLLLVSVASLLGIHT